MRIVAAVVALEVSGVDVGDALLDAVNHLSHFAKIFRETTTDRRVLRTPRGAVGLVQVVQGRIGFAGNQRRRTAVSDEVELALRASARCGVNRIESGALRRDITAVVVVIREAEVLELLDREDTRRGLPEISGQAVVYHNRRHVRGAVAARQVPPDPTAHEGHTERVRSLPDGSRDVVRETCVRISAALNEGHGALRRVQIVEPLQRRVQPEAGPAVRVSTDREQVARRQVHTAIARIAMGVVRLPQRRGSVIDRRDRIQAVVSSVEEDYDEISIADGVRQRLPDQCVIEESWAENRACGRALEEPSA